MTLREVMEEDDERRALIPASKVNKDFDFVDRDCVPARKMLAFMAFLGFFNVYCLRVNLSVAMVAMVNSTTEVSNLTKGQECPDHHSANSTTDQNTGEFDWDEKLQGYILGSFFYGYLVTQVPGGYLAARFGGKALLGWGVMCTSVLTLLTPLAARTSVYLFILLRVLEGIGEGVTFPAMHAMWGRWAPVWERSRLVTFSYAGSQIGTVFSLPISGILCDSDFLGGWPSVFYIFGTLGCVWFVAWMLLVHNSPSEHPRISREEREYIEGSAGKNEVLETPWRSILTSPVVWSLCVAHFANNWGFYTLLTCLPTYLKTILKFDMKENGFLSALPYAVMFVIQNIAGYVADFLRSRGYLSTKNTRKLLYALGITIPAAVLIGSGFVGCDHLVVISLLAVSVGASGLNSGGFAVNHLDIAPPFAGILMGLTNGVATIPGFLAPALVGVLTDHNQTMTQWHKIFFINGGVSLIGCIVYLIFAQGEEQDWSKRYSNKGKKDIGPASGDGLNKGQGGDDLNKVQDVDTNKGHIQAAAC